MANTQGGYILIGVQERNRVARGFFTVRDSQKVAKSINGVCPRCIEPPILGLEVEKRSFEWNDQGISLVIIHVLPSEIRPHGFRLKGSINFVKRVGDHTREYPMTDLAVDFSARHLPPVIHEINEKLDTINRSILQIRER